MVLHTRVYRIRLYTILTARLKTCVIYAIHMK